MARFLDVATWLYAGSLLVWFVARRLTGEQFIVVLGLNYMGPWLFLPVLVLGPWVLLHRQPSTVLALLVPTSLFLLLYGPSFVPRSGSSGPAVEPLTVMTWNLRYNNSGLGGLVGALDGEWAHVLTLQEVRGSNQVLASQVLGERYPYCWYVESAGLAIYSVYPFVAQSVYAAQPWPIQSAVLQVGDRQVHVINSHLAQPGLLVLLERLDPGVLRKQTAARAYQIGRIQEAIRDRALPSIVACDANMTDLTSSYGQITTGLRDAHRECGRGLGHTFLMPRGLEVPSPFNLPFQRIDYVFHSPEIRAARVRVIAGETGSDHRPVWAEFDLSQ